MKKPAFKTRSLLITATLGGLVLVYVYCVFMPTRRAIAEARTQLNEKRQFILASQQEYTEVGLLEQQLGKSQAWVTNWKQNAPKHENLGSFFRRIGEISRDSGARVERISPAESTRMKSLAKHPVTLVLGGDFPQLFAFIRAIEEMPLTVWIDRLELQSRSQTSESQTSEKMGCELSLTVFTDNQGISD